MKMKLKRLLLLLSSVFLVVILLSCTKKITIDAGLYNQYGTDTSVANTDTGAIASVEPLRNPDRGYHLESNYFAHSFINPFNTSETYPDGFIDKRERSLGAVGDSLTLVQLYVYLTEWVSKDIPQSGLDNIQTLFDGLRAKGYKAILRFAYNYTGLNTSGGESEQWIVKHLQQLKPLIEKNIGCIAVMQAGFVGAWGEWHTSPLEKDQAAKNAVVNALMATLPREYFVEIRYPDLKNALTFADASYRNRLGYANDYFTAGEHSHASGNDFVPGDAWYKQVAEESPGLYISGEIPYAEQSEWGLFNLINTNTTLQILRDHHYSAFDISQNFELNITSWKRVKVYPSLLNRLKVLFDESYFKDDDGHAVSRSFYEFVRDHLGYRLNLLASSSLKADNGNLEYDLNLTNTGFATVLNPREVYLVLINSSNSIEKEVKLSVNPRDWQPYDPVTKKIEPVVYNLKGTAAAGLSGKYKIGIWMPEPTEQRYNSRYDIRFAKNGMITHWQDADGKRLVNIIGEVSF